MTTTTDKPLDVVVPKRYYAQWWKIKQPYDRRFDEVAGTMYWSDTQQEIVVESLNPKYSAQVSNYLGSVIQLEHGLSVSAELNPKEWIRSLHLAQLGNGFYAIQLVETVDET